MGNNNKISRRKFLKKLSLGAASTLPLFLLPKSSKAASDNITISYDRKPFRVSLRNHKNNGEEKDYPYVATYTKGLKHNLDNGEVLSSEYKKFKKLLMKANFTGMERLTVGARGMANPQCGLAFDLIGPDPQKLKFKPAPRMDGNEGASELVELYWKAICRDIPFANYATDPLITDAIGELDTLPGFQGLKENGTIKPHTIFRGVYPGDEIGPYISQFLYKEVSYGSQVVDQAQFYFSENVDYMTNKDEWMFVQNGEKYADEQLEPPYINDRRYVITGRDLATYVYEDEIFQAYLNAALILLEEEVTPDFGNPYHPWSSTAGLATFGISHVLSLVSDVAIRALKAMFFQKWYVHRRARPEELGGRVHMHMTGAANYPMINSMVYNSNAVSRTFSKYGSYFLPQAYRDGSPLHPSYGSGHATIAGACVTVLKAFFVEDYPMPNPVVPDATGANLLPYTGPDAPRMTVGCELNKLASNVAMGRNFAGIHWRTDYSEALKLGEKVAIKTLQQLAKTYPEKHSFTLTRFNGKKIRISGKGYVK